MCGTLNLPAFQGHSSLNLATPLDSSRRISFDSKIWPNVDPLRVIQPFNICVFPAFMSLKVKPKVCCIYEYLLVINSKIWPNPSLLIDISLQNVSNVEFCISRSIQLNRISIKMTSQMHYNCSAWCTGLWMKISITLHLDLQWLVCLSMPHSVTYIHMEYIEKSLWGLTETWVLWMILCSYHFFS